MQPLPEPATYDLPRRANISIISAFSQHLDTTAEELDPRPEQFSARDNDLAIRDLHRAPHLLKEESGQTTPLLPPDRVLAGLRHRGPGSDHHPDPAAPDNTPTNQPDQSRP